MTPTQHMEQLVTIQNTNKAAPEKYTVIFYVLRTLSSRKQNLTYKNGIWQTLLFVFDQFPSEGRRVSSPIELSITPGLIIQGEKGN